MKSQAVNIAPTKTIKIRSHLSGSLFMSQTPLNPPKIPPNPRARTAPQLIEGENMKIMTADAFMVIARAFFVAPAILTCWPAKLSAASIRNPIPPPK